jgi:diadenosine tetraphosphate (Ap4A) HIT family hydrolase
MKRSAVAECVFCELREKNDRPILARTPSFFAIDDKYPVNVGHTLIIPFRHVRRLRDLTVPEFAELKEILEIVQNRLTDQNAEGFNIGVNEGDAAGQTVSHLHVHVIPRYAGDVESPRGGIRNLKSALVEY